MSQEVFEIMQGFTAENLDAQLAIQCAPVITGLKLSNLLMVHSEYTEQIESMLQESGLCCCRVMEQKHKTAILVYDENRLQSYLTKHVVAGMMKKFGYHTLQCKEVLKRFRRRYEAHLCLGEAFPHEMGLLLGYPPEDVWGFIVNKGENALRTGYWKVYADPDGKQTLFYLFECARSHLIQLVYRGDKMVDIIENYRKNRVQRNILFYPLENIAKGTDCLFLNSEKTAVL